MSNCKSLWAAFGVLTFVGATNLLLADTIYRDGGCSSTEGGNCSGQAGCTVVGGYGASGYLTLLQHPQCGAASAGYQCLSDTNDTPVNCWKIDYWSLANCSGTITSSLYGTIQPCYGTEDTSGIVHDVGGGHFYAYIPRPGR